MTEFSENKTQTIMSKSTADKPLETTKGQNVFMVDPRNIEPKEGFNGREFFDRIPLDLLKGSIKENGIITPLQLKKIKGTDKYQIVFGERRWRATMELVEEGFEMRVPAIMFIGNEVDATVRMLIENDHEKLSFVEEANVVKRLKAHGLSDKEIMLKTGRKKHHMLAYERILTAPEEVKKMINEKRISHTLVLEKINDKNLDPDQAFDAIKQLAVKVSEAGGEKKITKKKVDALLGKYDSVKELQKIIKLVESKEREFLDGQESEFLVSFATKLCGDKLSFEKLEKLLLKPKE